MNAYRIYGSLCVLAPLLLLNVPAFADEGSAQQNVVSSSHQNVVSSFGGCVRTKWQTDRDPCAAEVTPVKAAAPEIELGERTVYFGFNKASLSTDAVAKLNTLIRVIGHSKAITHVTVVGYADAIGTEHYNMALSRKRAQTVERYLASRVSIPTNVLVVKGNGESTSAADCSGKMSRKERIDCMAKDRRVEVQLNYEQ